MGFKDHILAARRTPSDVGIPHTIETKAAPTSTPRGRSRQKNGSNIEQPEPAELDFAARQPKRSSSFGRGLGGGLQSLTSGVVRASESLSRRNTSNGLDGTRTPPISGTTTPAATPSLASESMPPPKLPDSGHLPQFSLRLSELVNKSFLPCVPGTAAAPSSSLAGAAKSAAGKAAGSAAISAPPLASVVYEGRRLPNRDAIQEIAKTVVSELDYAAKVDTYLLRAVSRSALKALSLFADRMDSLVVTSSKDASAWAIPTTAKEGIAPPAALEYNLGLVALEWIVEDALERCIEGPPDTDGQGMPAFVSEILTPVRKKMEATIDHIVEPLLASMKKSVTMTLAKAVPAPFVSGTTSLSPTATHSGGAPVTSIPSVPSTPPTAATPSASSPPASALGATWIKELEGKVEGARRLLVPRLVERCGHDGEKWYIGVAIHMIWKGLMLLSARDMPPPGPICSKWPVSLLNTSLHLLATDVSKRSPSPAQLSSALKSVSAVSIGRKANDTRTAGTGPATPVVQQSAAQVAAALANASAKATAAQMADLQALDRIAMRAGADFVPRNTGSRTKSSTKDDDDASSSSDDDDEDELARAALAQGLRAIKSTITVVQYLDVNPTALLSSVRRRSRSSSTSNGTTAPSNGNLPLEALRAVRAIPPLLLLHLVYARMPQQLGVFTRHEDDAGNVVLPAIASPPATFEMTWAEYERHIAGFGSAEPWAIALIREWAQDVKEAWLDIETREESLSKSEDKDQVSTGTGSVAIPSAPATGLSAADQAITFGQDEATPTPASVLMQRTMSASTNPPADGTSSARSSDSLPRDMTASAPTLDREKEHLAREIAQASQHQQHATASQGKGSSRISWSTKLRRPSRSSAPSQEASPAATPETSPPRSPNTNAVDATDLSSNGRSTTPPRLRFWRSVSSTNTHSSSSGLSSPPLGTQAKPSLRSFTSRGGKGSATPTAAPVVAPISDEDRSIEELRLERDSVQLLSDALDTASYAFKMPSPVAMGSSTAGSTAAKASGASSPSAANVNAADLDAMHPEKRMSALSLTSPASRTPSFSSNA